MGRENTFGESNVTIKRNPIDPPEQAFQPLAKGEFISHLAHINHVIAAGETISGTILDMVDGDDSTIYNIIRSTQGNNTIEFTFDDVPRTELVTSFNYTIFIAHATGNSTTMDVSISEDGITFTDLSNDSVGGASNKTKSYAFGTKRLKVLRFSYSIANGQAGVKSVNIFR